MSGDETMMVIDLAHEAPFTLGDLAVRPATRELLAGQRREVLEPRVMQVLVALARRRDAVVSRDDLIAACWSGRVVGEDAINRCIVAIRRVAESWGGFEISTVARVGYRLSAAQTAPAAAEPLLAVLAFDNLSEGDDMAWFADGVSEEILQTVSKTPGLKMIGRSSSFQFRGREKAARHVAAELACSHVLDGSVRRAGARVRIAAHLIECAGQTTLWSDRFDRDLSDVFALQDEIAAAVAAALKLTFAPSIAAPPVDALAFDLYLRAKTQTPGRLGSYNAGLLEAATAIAPDFAQAWQALAITRAVEALFPIQGEDVTSLNAQAEKAARRALELDTGAGQALAALSLIEPICGRFAEREALLQRALAAAPNDAVVLFHASRAAYSVGRIAEARTYIVAAHRIERWAQGENWYAVLVGGPEGVEAHRAALAQWPTYEVLIVNGIVGSMAGGHWAEVERLREHALRHRVDTPWIRDAIETAELVRTWSESSKDRLLDRYRRQLAATGTMSLRVEVACGMGLTDEIYQLLDQASFDHLFEPASHWSGNDFGLHVIYQSRRLMLDARFASLCARLGLCDYWVTTERWPDCAADGVLPYDFKAACRRLATA